MCADHVAGVGHPLGSAIRGGADLLRLRLRLILILILIPNLLLLLRERVELGEVAGRRGGLHLHRLWVASAGVCHRVVGLDGVLLLLLLLLLLLWVPARRLEGADPGRLGTYGHVSVEGG